MNATVKSIVQRHHFPWRFSNITLSDLKKRWVMLSLISAVLLSAFAVIFVTNLDHELVSEQQTLLTVEQQLRNQQGELLVKQGAVSSQATVASTARKDLGMEMPTDKNIVMVKQ